MDSWARIDRLKVMSLRGLWWDRWLLSWQTYHLSSSPLLLKTPVLLVTSIYWGFDVGQACHPAWPATVRFAKPMRVAKLQKIITSQD